MPVLAGTGIGISILSLFAFCVIVISQTFPEILRPTSFIIAGLAILFLGLEIKSGKFNDSLNAVSVITLFGFVTLLIVRYAFLAHIILPPYSDSPIHYQIIESFLNSAESNQSNLSLGSIFSNYYHFGFHAISAWLIALTGIPIENAIALLGQSFLVIAPISIIVLTYELTKDIRGAWIAGMFAAIGWLMPSFAVNWGKYPAIAGLAALPSVLALISRMVKKSKQAKRDWIILTLTIAGMTLLHTRSIFVILLAVISIWIAEKIYPQKKMDFKQALFFSATFVLSLAPVIQLIKDFYSSIPTLICLVILLPFAFQSHPKTALAIFVFIFGAWMITLSPLPLLDRQFLEIMLYIPLALMGGLGFSGMFAQLPSSGIARPLITSVLAVCVIAGFIQVNTVYPDPCCNYYQQDDQSAFEWIRINGSAQSLFIIPSFSNGGQITGTDAGAWIEPLLGMNVNKLPYDVNWGTDSSALELCTSGAKQVYVYSSGRDFSFADKTLSTNKWFELVFQSGQTKIYLLIGCLK